MRPFYIFLGVLTTAIWGFNFVVIKFALVDIPPLLLTAERFALACLPVLFLARPKGLTWGRLIGIGLCMFLGQYVFLFVAMAKGMPAGLSSVLLQMQAFITILLATVFLHEKFGIRQILGGVLAVLGLGLIASTAGASSDIPAIAMVFIVLSAGSWAVGNVILKSAGPTAGGGTLAGVAWVSLVPPIPAFALSLYFEGSTRVMQSLLHPQMTAILALLFIVVASTWIAFAIWGKLMALYPASMVAPFTLLVPGFGTFSAWLFLGEKFSLLRLEGALLIMLGLAAIVLPARWLSLRRKTKKTVR